MDTHYVHHLIRNSQSISQQHPFDSHQLFHRSPNTNMTTNPSYQDLWNKLQQADGRCAHLYNENQQLRSQNTKFIAENYRLLQEANSLRTKYEDLSNDHFNARMDVWRLRVRIEEQLSELDKLKHDNQDQRSGLKRSYDKIDNSAGEPPSSASCSSPVSSIPSNSSLPVPSHGSHGETVNPATNSGPSVLHTSAEASGIHTALAYPTELRSHPYSPSPYQLPDRDTVDSRSAKRRRTLPDILYPIPTDDSGKVVHTKNEESDCGYELAYPDASREPNLASVLYSNDTITSVFNRNDVASFIDQYSGPPRPYHPLADSPSKSVSPVPLELTASLVGKSQAEIDAILNKRKKAQGPCIPPMQAQTQTQTQPTESQAQIQLKIESQYQILPIQNQSQEPIQPHIDTLDLSTQPQTNVTGKRKRTAAANNNSRSTDTRKRGTKQNTTIATGPSVRTRSRARMMATADAVAVAVADSAGVSTATALGGIDGSAMASRDFMSSR